MIPGEGRADSIIGPVQAKGYFDLFMPEKPRGLIDAAKLIL